ncbi:MAG TPA: YHS domain-containing (seleno)protein [Nitrosopumilaceae archaeon]|nr:YHS domain-containing (seleno)protein [Nitrosopumilaceae archaeon]
MKKTILMLSIIMTAITVHPQSQEVFSTKGSAINGYDAVSYFKESKPVKGNSKFILKWKEATWYFSSKENLATFKANPEMYAPQYGGFCAYGTSEGHKAPTDPSAWTVADGKLYLNYNSDVKTMWRKNQKALIEKADMNWPKIKNSKE